MKRMASRKIQCHLLEVLLWPLNISRQSVVTKLTLPHRRQITSNFYRSLTNTSNDRVMLRTNFSSLNIITFYSLWLPLLDVRVHRSSNRLTFSLYVEKSYRKGRASIIFDTFSSVKMVYLILDLVGNRYAIYYTVYHSAFSYQTISISLQCLPFLERFETIIYLTFILVLMNSFQHLF